MVKEFYELDTWKKARDSVILTYKLTKVFPKEEMYGLISQIRRSVSSICANLAEGFNRYHPKDKIRFYYNSRGSISETQNHILIARELGYVNSESADDLVNELDTVRKMLNGMIRALRDRS